VTRPALQSLLAAGQRRALRSLSAHRGHASSSLVITQIQKNR
jgi:hypothetical protein